MKEDENLHKVALEEVLQLPLRCRIGQVADVQAATLGGTGMVGGLVVSSRLVLVGLARDRSVGQSIGNVVDGGGGGVGDLLHVGGHCVGY